MIIADKFIPKYTLEYLNAAINLKNYTASSVGINACGDVIRPKQSVRAASMKQEADTK